MVDKCKIDIIKLCKSDPEEYAYCAWIEGHDITKHLKKVDDMGRRCVGHEEGKYDKYIPAIYRDDVYPHITLCSECRGKAIAEYERLKHG